MTPPASVLHIDRQVVVTGDDKATGREVRGAFPRQAAETKAELIAAFSVGVRPIWASRAAFSRAMSSVPMSATSPVRIYVGMPCTKSLTATSRFAQSAPSSEPIRSSPVVSPSARMFWGMASRMYWSQPLLTSCNNGFDDKSVVSAALVPYQPTSSLSFAIRACTYRA